MKNLDEFQFVIIMLRAQGGRDTSGEILVDNLST